MYPSYEPSPSSKAAWDLPVRALKGVGPKLAALFEKSDIRTLWDLLLTLPKSYEDRRNFFNREQVFEALAKSQQVYAKGKILKYSQKRLGARGQRLVEAQVLLVESHETLPFTLTFVWFHSFALGIEERFAEGAEVVFSGKVQSFNGRLQITHPELFAANGVLPRWESGGWIPVYKEIGGLSTRVLRRIMAAAIDRAELKALPELLPQKFREEYPSLAESLRELHFPQQWKPESSELRPGGLYFERVVFEELFLMSLALHLRRAEWRESAKLLTPDRLARIEANVEKVQEWRNQLPFALTTAQEQALNEIFKEFCFNPAPVPMHRLLQGDVGSGKTIVAFLSALVAMDAGYQVALMAPTEILANQHYQNFSKLFPQYASQAALLKGALKVSEKKQLRHDLESGQLRFVIGTQALLTDTTIFERLGYVIVDEQHRFGVEQRLGLKHQDRKISPHLLVMTATPIPRSLALTLYGDLNLSVLREKPVGRKPIRTYLIKSSARSALKKRVQELIGEGRQIYIVYPLVEESEELDLKDAIQAHAEWEQELKGSAVGLLHGRLKPAQKDAVMRDFKAGHLRVLVSTTVIEVGVDVPEASVMIIEHAERFGLSQLHQLRGRVGRGERESLCVLVGPDKPGPLVRERLEVLVQSDDGFVIAEKDLELRGPGEFLGRRQSGLPGFRVAHVLRDVALLEEARALARALLDSDPRLRHPQHQALREGLNRWWSGRLELTLSG